VCSLFSGSHKKTEMWGIFCSIRVFWTRGLYPGVYVRQSWNLAYKSALCDSVGFIRPCHWTGDSDLGGYVRGGLRPVTMCACVCVCDNFAAVRQWSVLFKHSRFSRGKLRYYIVQQAVWRRCLTLFLGYSQTLIFKMQFTYT